MQLQQTKVSEHTAKRGAFGLIHFVALILVSLLYGNTEIIAQDVDWQHENREVIVTYKDSVVRTQIQLQNPHTDISNNLDYYWYSKNTINHNIGGYSGQLLHGGYSVFDKNNNLITQGNFINGLKEDQWKTWDSGGMLKTILEYKHGLLDGKMIVYDETGNIIDSREYKDSELVVEKEKKEGGFFHFLKKDSMADTVQVDSTFQPVEINNNK